MTTRFASFTTTATRLHPRGKLAGGFRDHPKVAPTVEAVSGPDSRFVTGMAIFAANVALIDRADAVVADFSPFRGPSADVGTVWEVAYAYAKGKPIAAYSEAQDLYRIRVPRQPMHPELDLDGLAIEQFDMADNSMLVGSIFRSCNSDTSLLAHGGISSTFERALNLVLEQLDQRKYAARRTARG